MSHPLKVLAAPLPFLMSVVLALSWFVTAAVADTEANRDYEAVLNGSVEVLDAFLSHEQWDGVINVMGGARAVYIAPEERRVGLIVGKASAHGALLRRRGDQWSDPVFMGLDILNIGFQAGVSSSRLVMIITTDRAVDKLVDGVRQASSGGGFALGNLGLSGAGGGDASGGLEVLMVSTSRGVFLGGNLGSLKMLPLPEMNQAAYGGKADLKSLLGDDARELAAAASLQDTLARITQRAWGTD